MLRPARQAVQQQIWRGASSVALVFLFVVGPLRPDDSRAAGGELTIDSWRGVTPGWSIKKFSAPDRPDPPAAEQPATNDAQNPSADDPNAGQQNQGGHDRDRHHHHHHHGQGTIWLWPPVIWGGGFSPGFWPYDGSGGGFLDRGMGVWSPAANQPVAAPRPSDPAPADRQKSKIRVTSAEVKARAGKFMGYGDTHFSKQSYLAAAERYKKAAQMAPDLAEPYLRQAFAFVAMGNYESAAKALRRALAVRSDWNDSPFRLEQLYGAQKIAKTAHLENLAKAVEDNPLDAQLLTLLGMQMFFDGQAQRSEVFFTRAAQLGGNSDKLLDHFLPPPAPAGVPRADRANAPGARDASGKVVF
ncbi:MAG: hypothetical protein AB7O59_13070 [Pirellulales bacterium]